MNKVVIAFSTDANYKYYTGVAIHSLIEHSSAENQYEIVILEENLKEEDRNILLNLVSGYKNFSMSFINMTEKINEIGRDKFYLGIYSVATYYRLFLPEILTQYDRLLYFDSDVLIQEDVAVLFETPLGNSPIAAARDVNTDRFPMTYLSLKVARYCRQTLKLKSSARYINAGVLLLSLEQLRRENFTEHAMEQVRTGVRFLCADQDVFNILYEGKFCPLDGAWNYIPQKESEKIKTAKVIHYAGIYPWKSHCRLYAEQWWKQAEKTPFYPDMCRDLIPIQMAYLKEIEQKYTTVLNSTSWKITSPIRFLRNLPGYLRFILFGIDYYKK